MSTERHKKEFTASASYLVLPIQNGGAKGKMALYVDDEIILDYGLALATGPETTDWYAFFSIERFKGEHLRVEASNATDEGFALVRQSDTIPGEDDFYTERMRPQFHFTSKTGWLNDPNGLIYYKGTYHMYYQHNPVALPWGNMTWGHAVSTDLVHWEEQPKVLFPDAKTGTCYSGAMFIDHRNLLERKTGDEDVLVAFYLRTETGLCLAYSNDCGQTFTDYEDNPVLTHDGERIDTPRPFWYEPTKRWIAPTYDFFENDKGEKRRCVGFYSSENLTDWQFESRVTQEGWGDELCGCVDFFQLPVDGNPDAPSSSKDSAAASMKWVMIMIDGSYIVGSFDGHTFYTLEGKPAVAEDRVRTLASPLCNYATQTWHNMPDDRRVQITWARSGNHPRVPFNQQMSLVSELTLHSTDAGPQLRMNPIKELETLRVKTHAWTDIVLKKGENPLSDLKGDLFDIEVEFAPSANSQTVFDLRGMKVTYDAATETLTVCRAPFPLAPIDGTVRLRILLDRTSVEAYGNDGAVYVPYVDFPAEDNLSLSATCDVGEANVSTLRIHELKSSWQRD